MLRLEIGKKEVEILYKYEFVNLYLYSLVFFDFDITRFYIWNRNIMNNYWCLYQLILSSYFATKKQTINLN